MHRENLAEPDRAATEGAPHASSSSEKTHRQHSIDHRPNSTHRRGGGSGVGGGALGASCEGRAGCGGETAAPLKACVLGWPSTGFDASSEVTERRGNTTRARPAQATATAECIKAAKHGAAESGKGVIAAFARLESGVVRARAIWRQHQLARIEGPRNRSEPGRPDHATKTRGAPTPQATAAPAGRDGGGAKRSREETEAAAESGGRERRQKRRAPGARCASEAYHQRICAA